MSLGIATADEVIQGDTGADTLSESAVVVDSFKYDIPSITPDTEIFRRTPVVDGNVESGEWDAFYAFSVSGWDVTTYADWDAGSFYAAVKSTRPLDFLVVLDCDDDGWFHGENNYEFRTSRGPGDSINLAVSRYESRNTKIPIAIPVSTYEASMVDIKSSHAEGAYSIEMRIPINMIQGFKMVNEKPIGLQLAVNAASDETGWIPNNELGDTRDCTLVTKKFASLKPIELGFDLRDTVVARGDDLVGRFHLKNSGSETADVKSYTIAGEGKAGQYLSSERVRLEGVAPGQHIAKDYRSALLSTMNVGSWALGAEVRSEDGRLGSMLVSFDVVEPFDLDIKLPDKDVKANVKDVTVAVVISNNKRVGMNGKAKITFPAGWEVWRNIDQRDFRVSARSSSSVSFKAKPPLGAIGDIPVKIDVTCNGESKTVDGSFRVVNP
jgi:hypothetical protein